MTHPSIAFLLPAKGASGGANSVVQESIGLSRLGAAVRIIVGAQQHSNFIANYPELHTNRVPVRAFTNVKEISKLISGVDVACATTNGSVRELHAALGALSSRRPKAAYYIQDYEPLFYPPHSESWKRARESYELVRGIVAFAKTQWICDVVYDNHGLRVSKVEPSLDHDVFYPGSVSSVGHLTIAAMLRPQTPRRAPRRTIRVLDALRSVLGEKAHLHVFGCDDHELNVHGLSLPAGVKNHGSMKRTEVPNLLRHADLFLDLSDYQAFGRTAIEGMACGCVPVVPVLGGACEFAQDSFNAYVVDTRSDNAIVDAVQRYAALSDEDREEMRFNALQTASHYTVVRAALSELRLFRQLATA